ncbi:MAG: YraN family protein [Alphaproteobacteria bacterium]|nr:MAG: YraN family protein [Alphaproteobacteria bacterium]
MSAQARQRAERRGQAAERLAALLLMMKGYRILARRHRTPAGEIDLIAARGRRLVFAEVKRRAHRDEAAESITARQQARIARAAAFWLARNPAYGKHDIGFDAVLLAPRRWPRHLRDAFRV